MRPYTPLYHPKTWRMFEAYGNGILGDMGVHMLDLARWYLDLKYPKRIWSTGGIFVERGGKRDVTDTQTVTYDYDDLQIVWEHRSYGPPVDGKRPWGVTFTGDKGSLTVTLSDWEFVPSDKTTKPRYVEAVKEPDPTKLEGDIVVPAGRAHMKDFLANVATRGRPLSDIEEGHISTAMCLFGNISCKVGRPLTWDAEASRFVADAPANRMLRRTYRKPWKYPG
jgi:predicted dehydrogenase